jgi:hypothetical protein
MSGNMKAIFITFLALGTVTFAQAQSTEQKSASEIGGTTVTAVIVIDGETIQSQTAPDISAVIPANTGADQTKTSASGENPPAQHNQPAIDPVTGIAIPAPKE